MMDGLVRSRTFAHLAGAVGIVGQLLAAFSYILVPALTVPPPATYVFVAAWFVLLGMTIASWQHHPWRSFVVPVVSVPAVTVVLSIGGQFLGWEA